MLKPHRTRTLIAIAFLLVPALCWNASDKSGAALAATFRSFHTPSGNIGCYTYGGYLRCDIGQKSWQGPPRPASCMGAYGDSLTMTATGRPRWGCHGDTALRSGPALAYGKNWRSGAFTCTSRFNGLTCTNRAGHGFFLSKQSYRTF